LGGGLEEGLNFQEAADCKKKPQLKKKGDQGIKKTDLAAVERLLFPGELVSVQG